MQHCGFGVEGHETAVEHQTRNALVAHFDALRLAGRAGRIHHVRECIAADGRTRRALVIVEPRAIEKCGIEQLNVMAETGRGCRLTAISTRTAAFSST